MRRREDGESDAVPELVDQAQAGDTAAFRQLVEACMRPVYAQAWRLLRDHDDADDVAQETFVRAWQALKRYDGRTSFQGWLHTIATRLALNVIAKRQRRRTSGGEDFERAAETQQSGSPGPEAQVELAETRIALEQVLHALPDAFRLPLLLRTYEGLSYAEIARNLDLPMGTVMSRLHRARLLVRQGLERRGVHRLGGYGDG